jgi:hypothetical protein
MCTKKMKIWEIFMNLVDPMIKFIKNFGFARSLGYVIMCVCVIFTTVSLFNLDNTIQGAINRNELKQIEAHDKAVEKRYANSPKIEQILNEVLYKYGADRVCVIEMHNGTKNVAGLPFIYGEMTYEVCRDGILPVDADYTQFNLSRLSFPTFMFEHNAFCGGMADLSKIDEKFAERLLVNNSTYLCGYTLHGSDNIIGYFGIVWCGGIPTETNQLMKDLSAYAQRLSILLN